ncbi:LLM class flavin-dependent oxidoreductase [Paradevosia shaoguanensis]|uniref:Luciferase-like monooxygenase n=1 Tax=Paradevosia shaoguanensis TaxID=1335043 RepID=A0AA41QQ93_9HYPH|nr:LLM class flavin-dependent oxidoreductase [Paradevosia shaoguanensis]MCF1743830.1 LLM class flavin-dependent oxidoreductase [Paradevosia shaoguanensis]MCI0128313.1 LLM class flavin-dependent oxidoreductase [Paradevosia shaoguanensis]
MAPIIPLSLLDLAPIAEGTSTADALAQTVRFAQTGEKLGYTRLWYAEHHGMPSIASSAPDILIASAGAHTSAIRVGSGGVMLPNHVPLRVAEDFRTLEGLYPGRVDLGIGRAGGSDGRTLQALRSFGGEHFSEQLAELLAFDTDGFPQGHPFGAVRVVPDNIGLPPIWLLGSSGASAHAAGQMGMGYAFAAHFSATPPKPAFDAYRQGFVPSAQFPEPHTIVCVSVVCAPTDEEAQFLSGSQELSWALFHSGRVRKLVAPEEAAAHDYTPGERAIIENQRPLWIVGSPETVKRKILEKIEGTGASEVMIATTMYSYELRLRSIELVAKAFGIEPRA